LSEEIEISTSSIFGTEFHVVHIASGKADSLHSSVNAFITVDTQLPLQVRIGSSNEYVDTGVISLLK